ncbi:unnamed protein product [Phytophthora fragariaefolia]|uniref:Unnamed protein product n=1 Tax=Phytophthora fragariaefolia TaxID=1490495 RepID=A0A9W6U9R1_9STRA|nr:unnamed protein product [Phytophthora fragariaefolia]
MSILWNGMNSDQSLQYKTTIWGYIAAASNDYFLEKVNERVEDQYNKQLARLKKQPQFKPNSQDPIRAELSKIEDITARELCVLVGLLVTRTIAPHKEKIGNHWKVTDVGAIPRGCFGQFMVRDRLMFEVYCRKHELPTASGAPIDYNSGPTAVVCNLREVFGQAGPGAGARRLVVMDRFCGTDRNDDDRNVTVHDRIDLVQTFWYTIRSRSTWHNRFDTRSDRGSSGTNILAQATTPIITADGRCTVKSQRTEDVIIGCARCIQVIGKDRGEIVWFIDWWRPKDLNQREIFLERHK